MPNYVNTIRPSTRHIIIKLSKVNDRERILKTVKGKKTVTYKGNLNRLSLDFSVETLQASKEWNDTFKLLKD